MALRLRADGWVEGLRHAPSPNFNARPPGTAIDLLVIHAISLPACRFGGPYVEALFLNQLDPAAHPDFAGLDGLRVSAHFVIDRAGVTTQYVATEARAWHAGVSHFDGRDNCNDFSLGIELEGCDSAPFTDAQYHALIDLIRLLRGHYPAIDPGRITGHSDIAPGRKTDPGPLFDWDRLRAGL